MVISSSSLVIAAWRSLLYSRVRSLIMLRGVVGGVLHRHHPGAVLGGAGLEDHLVDLVVHVLRQDAVEDDLGRLGSKM